MTHSERKREDELNPYLNARNEWNERYGSYVKHAHNWRVVALLSLCTALLSAGGFFYLSSQQKVVPYIIETNSFGEVVRTVQAEQPRAPNEKEMKAALRTWIIGARTIYVDSNAQEAIMNTTYAMTLADSPAFHQISAYHRDDDPYRRAAYETVEVKVNAVVPVTDTAWRVEWTEINKQRSGKVIETKNWEGTFTVEVIPPVDPETIMVNPLGIYVERFAWTQRI
ncbi:VirB8/TrbF family protein [Brucella sp. NBRC 12950]|uniref:VirB8/TrbF family protein n=1 Tax=Brucella sp. NBRC 12950 TaxID=2994518 RepID=UPI0024A259C4|nr:VirB8/TrbF family protein [Brucella sp. NBRC 12950]GLU28239.1 putative conjugal transfer protein TrbF [Brucella sp. NBRC 12950]